MLQRLIRSHPAQNMVHNTPYSTVPTFDWGNMFRPGTTRVITPPLLPSPNNAYARFAKMPGINDFLAQGK